MKTIFGAAALKVKFDEIQSLLGSGKTITLERLQLFHVYRQFLDDASMEEVNQWTSDIVSSSAVVAASMLEGGGASSSSAGPPVKKAKTGKKRALAVAADNEVESQVFSLFA